METSDLCFSVSQSLVFESKSALFCGRPSRCVALRAHSSSACVFLFVCVRLWPHLRKLVANSIRGISQYVNEGRPLGMSGG